MKEETRMPLTETQGRVLSVIQSWAREHGWPPTLREICAEIGVSSPETARQHVDALVRKGYVERGRGARALRAVW